MSYGVYEYGGRFAGYGVPAICEHPDCNERIDRGFSFACGGGIDKGCDRYFCIKHLAYSEKAETDICERCMKNKKPFPQKPEHEEWIKHILTDKTWGEWREENKDKVKLFSKQIQDE